MIQFDPYIIIFFHSIESQYFLAESI